MIQLGDRIKRLREKREMTQKDLSKKTGLTIVQISRYENNERKPDPEALTKLVDALESNADYLLGRTSDSSPPNTEFRPEVSVEEGVYIAYLGGPPEEMDEVEAQHLKQELEEFRRFREMRRKQMEQQKDK